MFGNSLFAPASPQAHSLANLTVLILIVMLAIFSLVASLVIYAAMRFRARAQQREPRQVFGSARLETGWTVGAALVVVLLFVASVRAMHTADPPPLPQRQPDLVIVAHQWWWEAHYPRSGVVTANEIHIPVGQAWLVRLDSADVIHDWWVAALGRKMDAIPGHPNHFWIQADKPGTYLGTCAEYCGAEHAWMRIRVVAQSAADFQAWQQQQLAIPLAPTEGDAAAGSKLFGQLTCQNCHTIAGTSAKATIGPELTHLASRQTLAAGRLDNTPDNLDKWLSNPQRVKPGCYMPNFNLSHEQVHNLVAYLETLK